ncbi:MAG TPA: polysaccharide pyruvyl transferase family protein [Armatimonadota bacterium]|nr:polysaccharide pyruvyl transferase family protein [Armatimonadota bacterium]
MTQILLLHAYSAANRGDGLLVDEALELLHQAFGDSCTVTLVARAPETFAATGAKVLAAPPGPSFIRDLPQVLAAWRRADLVVGVGGGFARGDRALPFLKFFIGHGWQLVLARARGRHAVYLPQSVGPFHPAIWPALRWAYGGLALAAVRDGRSLTDLGLQDTSRMPDCAVLTLDAAPTATAVDPVPVFTARPTGPRGDARCRALAARLGTFDSFVQSSTLGNDDTSFVTSLGARAVVPAESLADPTAPRRVVVAVRLHAALMALRAGHLVIHLSYERKGFGAFEDLGLDDWVHNVNDVDVDLVANQVRALVEDTRARERYAAAVASALPAAVRHRERLVHHLRGARRA